MIVIDGYRLNLEIFEWVSFAEHLLVLAPTGIAAEAAKAFLSPQKTLSAIFVCLSTRNPVGEKRD
jgi:hypothetical protein